MDSFSKSYIYIYKNWLNLNTIRTKRIHKQSLVIKQDDLKTKGSLHIDKHYKQASKTKRYNYIRKISSPMLLEI